MSLNEERGPMNGWYEVPKSQSHKRGVKPATKIRVVYPKDRRH
jgi:hypothetical protein